MTFEELQPEYAHRLASMKLTQEAAAKAIAAHLLLHKDKFVALQDKCGVPALWVMPVFERENPSFDSYLGNGDPLNHKTTHDPANRGPFQTWEDGAIDALKLDDVTLCPEWTWEWACYEWEKWNGFGPRLHGRPTGYLWSGTNQYSGGKYIRDGVWSRGTWDHQLGTVIIARQIAAMDEEIAKGFAASNPSSSIPSISCSG